MDTPADLDEMIANGEIEIDPEARMHARMRHLWKLADVAFRQDPEYAIEIAKAASAAVILEAERQAGATSLSAEEKKRRERRRVQHHESYLRRKAAIAAAAASQEGDEANP
ncbi:hypothetical protein [Microbacterium sp. W4I20]|uniref:hypothetical protein n=1 Tax=Microbacterium sp. W4I20 TaxID=3042262 RepID=UPI0027D7FB1A|nr:hypothetical protein [Microbacterium sp. W4I20]